MIPLYTLIGLLWIVSALLYGAVTGRVGICRNRPGRYALWIKRWYFGVEKSTIVLTLNGRQSPYMTRWILYIGPVGLRLHKFYQGDDPKAPHDHPFWFITILLFHGYWEMVFDDDRWGWTKNTDNGQMKKKWIPLVRHVAPWRFHYRPSGFKHIVVGRSDDQDKPFWTLCIFGFTHPNWGFYPRPGEFVHWQEWDQKEGRGKPMSNGGVQ